MIVPFPTVLIDLSAEEISTNERLANPILRVSVVGVGGAGNNLLSHAIGGGVSPSRWAAVNTDKGQLSRSLARNKIFLGQRVSPTAPKVVTRRDAKRTLQRATPRWRGHT